LSPSSITAVQVGALRVDNRGDRPPGVDDTTPTLSWKLSGSGAAARETAYEVKVSDGAGAELWDSGKVAGTSTQATYAGKPLTSHPGQVAGAGVGRQRRGVAME
jgi:alpha-L-rhamnosidase